MKISDIYKSKNGWLIYIFSVDKDIVYYKLISSDFLLDHYTYYSPKNDIEDDFIFDEEATNNYAIKNIVT